MSSQSTPQATLRPHAQPQTQPQTQAQAQPQAQTQAQPQAQTQAQAQAQARAQPRTQLQTQPQSSQQPLPPLSQCQPIEVLTTTHGTPERVRWEGVEYICGDIPLDWIWHQAWWRAEVPIDGEIDIVAWRLRLLPLPGQRVTRERCIDAVLRQDATWVLLEEIA